MPLHAGGGHRDDDPPARRGPAGARTFEVGEVEGTANVELSYGVLTRVEDRDPDLVAIANGGKAASANWDDGDLSYDEGIASNAVQANVELSARWRSFGAYARGIGFYDFETEHSDRERTELSHDAEPWVGKDLELRDYYLHASFSPGGMPVRVRLHVRTVDAELTPMGAERGANADGTIPAWTGGLHLPPPGFQPGTRQIDAYAGDPVLYTVTAADLARYGALLSDGQKALLKAYPDTWRLNVHATRRSAAYPAWVYEAVRLNATRARVILEGKGSVADARVGPPFPIPHSGVEVIWNHNLRWRGARVERKEGIAAVTRLGRYRGSCSTSCWACPMPHSGPMRSARRIRTCCWRSRRRSSRRRGSPTTPRW